MQSTECLDEMVEAREAANCEAEQSQSISAYLLLAPIKWQLSWNLEVQSGPHVTISNVPYWWLRKAAGQDSSYQPVVESSAPYASGAP